MVDAPTRPSHPRKPSLDANASELQKKLEQRPPKEALVERNILKDDHGVSPALVVAREQLQRSQLQDTLSNALAHRPTKEELESKGIMQKPEDEEGSA
ncbi:Rpel repeat protein [Mycena kentingensis (nom. inval.)]|nr:Rpel repeat protein [Mycena kentingensis (nom. inval.)]